MTDPLTEAADDLLASLTEDDLIYDMPVSMSGEPMDPVLFVRWGAVAEAIAAERESIAPLGREREAFAAGQLAGFEDGIAAGEAAERERIASLVEAVKHQRRLRGGEHTLEASRAADAAVAAALAEWEAHE